MFSLLARSFKSLRDVFGVSESLVNTSDCVLNVPESETDEIFFSNSCGKNPFLEMNSNLDLL